LNTDDAVRAILLQEIVADIANDLITRMKAELENMDKVVFGNASKSIEYYPTDKIVGSFLDYIRNIEYGRIAGTHVPLEPLHDWAVKKFNMEDSYAWAFAKTVEKKIFENGIPMTRFCKLALGELTQ